jgi:hypothetical protein
MDLHADIPNSPGWDYPYDLIPSQELLDLHRVALLIW